MKLTVDEIIEIIHDEMWVKNDKMLGAYFAAEAIIRAEEKANKCCCHNEPVQEPVE